MEHDRQMALKAEAEKIAARKKRSEAQRNALHVQMQERENLKREVRTVMVHFFFQKHAAQGKIVPVAVRYGCNLTAVVFNRNAGRYLVGCSGKCGGSA